MVMLLVAAVAVVQLVVKILLAQALTQGLGLRVSVAVAEPVAAMVL